MQFRNNTNRLFAKNNKTWFPRKISSGNVDCSKVIKIQSFVRMFIQRKKFLKMINRKVLKLVKRKIDNVDYLVCAILNFENDMIIEAMPLDPNGLVPKVYHIPRIKFKEYGIEDLNYVSNLLG